MERKIFPEEFTLESYYYKVIISFSCPSFQNYTIHIITSQVDNGNLFKIEQEKFAKFALCEDLLYALFATYLNRFSGESIQPPNHLV